MAASDETGKRFYGSTILPLLYLPIPRYMWPDKPRTNEYAFELSSSLRPVTQVGMTPLLAGESYVNFGWMGCAFIPFLYMLGMQMAFQRVRNLGITSAARLVYVVFLVTMIQVVPRWAELTYPSLDCVVSSDRWMGRNQHTHGIRQSAWGDILTGVTRSMEQTQGRELIMCSRNASQRSK